MSLIVKYDICIVYIYQTLPQAIYQVALAYWGFLKFPLSIYLWNYYVTCIGLCSIEKDKNIDVLETNYYVLCMNIYMYDSITLLDFEWPWQENKIEFRIILMSISWDRSKFMIVLCNED